VFQSPVVCFTIITLSLMLLASVIVNLAKLRAVLTRIWKRA